MDNRLPRPHMVRFFNCSGIRIIDTNFKDCPTWTMQIQNCENGTIGKLDDIPSPDARFVVGIGPAAK